MAPGAEGGDVGDASVAGGPGDPHATALPPSTTRATATTRFGQDGELGATILSPLCQDSVESGHGGDEHEPTVTDTVGLPSPRSPSFEGVGKTARNSAELYSRTATT